jgi:hypothetical protein
VPITPFLRGQAFEPELIEAMSAAFTDRAEPITELVARQIIEFAERGVRTQTALYFMAVAEFKANPQ